MGAEPDAPVSRIRPVAQYRVLVGAVVFMVAVDLLLGLLGPPTTGWAGPFAGVALQLVADVSLLFLRRAPRAVGVLIVVVSVLMAVSRAWAPGLFVPEVQLSPITVPRVTGIAVIWLVLTQPARFSYPVTAVLTVLAARIWAPSWTETPFGLLTTVLPAVLALWIDARRRLVRSLRDRAERAEREQHLLAERARSDERRRLAAEMHDVVTHRISAMVLHAGALGVSSQQPDVRRAADDIRESGALALAELRDLVGVLRLPSGTPEPAVRPGAGSPPHPSELTGGAGMPVELTVEGAPEDVEPTVARTVYRVVQESLTNVRKHAPGAAVTVLVRYRPEPVCVEVVNATAARAPDPELAGSGTGAGLDGLRHRVELIGGTLDHGPTADGGFRVGATLSGYVPTPEVSER